MRVEKGSSEKGKGCPSEKVLGGRPPVREQRRVIGVIGKRLGRRHHQLISTQPAHCWLPMF